MVGLVRKKRAKSIKEAERSRGEEKLDVLRRQVCERECGKRKRRKNKL